MPSIRHLSKEAMPPFLLGILDSLGEGNSRIMSFEPESQFPTTLAWGQIPLYIEHLTLII